MLHIVSCNHSNPALQHCLAIIDQGDEILLIESGVECLCSEVNWPCPVYILEADLKARGLDEIQTVKNKISNSQSNPNTLSQVDDRGFVELCVKHQSNKSWF